jgi:hypothetical protein
VIIGSYRIEGEDSESQRMAAQLVLSKLHRMQRLVNQLSLKLKDQVKKEQREAESSVDDPSRFLAGMEAGEEGALPLSGSILDELAGDLRRRLRTLSLEVVDQLRRYHDD